jgi:hypothetical protein
MAGQLGTDDCLVSTTGAIYESRFDCDISEDYVVELLSEHGKPAPLSDAAALPMQSMIAITKR